MLVVEYLHYHLVEVLVEYIFLLHYLLNLVHHVLVHGRHVELYQLEEHKLVVQEVLEGHNLVGLVLEEQGIRLVGLMARYYPYYLTCSLLHSTDVM